MCEVISKFRTISLMIEKWVHFDIENPEQLGQWRFQTLKFSKFEKSAIFFIFSNDFFSMSKNFIFARGN